MPTTYTHYAYGQEIFEKLPESIQKEIDVSERISSSTCFFFTLNIN